MDKMRGVAYIRVSTKEQDENIQRKEIEQFAKNRGIEIVKWFIDKGESGSKAFKDRPAAKELLKFLENEKVDVIVTFAIDRLGRTMLDTLNTILNFEKQGIKVISIKEEWLQHLDSNIRKLILSILSWAAEFELKRRRERQEAAWRAGKQKGRPPKLPLQVYERYIKKYWNKGLSLRAIWRIMMAEGYKVDYTTFLRNVKKIIKSS